VRSGLVEVRPPRLDLAPGVGQRQEPVRVQASSDTLGDRRTNLCLAQHKRDLLARELRLLHAKSTAQISSDFARSLLFPLEAFSGTGSPRHCAIEKASSRLKAKLQKAGERAINGPWACIGKLRIFQPDPTASTRTAVIRAGRDLR